MKLVPARRALILGIGGQDGLFMSYLLSSNGYEITGVLRPEDMSSETVPNIPKEVRLANGSITDEKFITKILREIQPDEIYNFAGISFIPYSWEAPEKVAEINGWAVSLLLKLIVKECPGARFFQAGSSEMFGHTPFCSPQDENTPFIPDNPYASAKVFAANITRNYRAHYGIYGCIGILYNHESEWRGREFVTRKIAKAAAAIKKGAANRVELGNLHAVRDWSYAGDVVRAMWLMMTADQPGDYVLASGKLHSVTDCLNIAFSHVGLKWQDHVLSVPGLSRELESKPLCGNPSLAMQELGWRPTMTFESLIQRMVDIELERLENGRKR